MGRADSPLKDRVVFVEGAPRSGTTLLNTLLASHPEVAGVAAEPRIFEYGLRELFENFDESGFLDVFVDREELLDLARNFADGVLESMRERQCPGARFVIEKTPAPRREPAVVLGHKASIYPDGWYVHILREEEEVVRSLMRAPWNDDRSESGCRDWCRSAVAATRDAFGSLDRYREVDYKDLAADPRRVVADLLGWLGLDVTASDLDRIEALSKAKYADLGPVDVQVAGAEAPRPAAPSRSRTARRRLARLPALVRGASPAFRVRGRSPDGYATAKRFAEAFHARDLDELGRLLATDVEVILRSGTWNVAETGARAVDVLGDIASRAFGTPFLSESWYLARGEEHTTMFRGMRRDASQLDLWWAFVIGPQGIARVTLIAAGDL